MNKNSGRLSRILSFFMAICMLFSCTDAFGECSHEYTYSEKTFDGYGESHSPSAHLVWYEVYTYCKDCGEEVGYDFTEEWLPHSVVNGVCACGYSDDFQCGHPVRDDEVYSTEYEYVSAQEHLIIRWIDTICGICGEVADTNGEDLGTEAHTFGGNGLCTKCGYQKQRATKFCSRCNEMRTWTSYSNYTLYSQMVNNQHAKWIGTVEKCDHCGYTVEKKMDSQVFEDHVFVDGKCICGAKGGSVKPTTKPTAAPCDHGGTTVYDRVDKFSYSYSKYNSSQHIKRTKDQVFCPCGEMVHENNWEEYEKHSMSNGICVLCGYANQAANPNVPSATKQPSVSNPSSSDAPSFPGILSRGSASNTRAKVKELQKLLMQNGYALPRYGADGDFGAETENAVKKFQADHGLNATGIVDEETWNKLVSPNAPEEPSEEEHEHAFVDGVCSECGLFDRKTCEHVYSMPYRTDGAMKYYRCVLCQNELLIVSRLPDSFKGDLETFAKEAATNGTDTNKAYKNILDASKKTAFHNLFSSIMDQYRENGKFETTTENLYKILSDIPGYVISAFSNEKEFESKFNAQLELSIKRALLQQSQNDLIQTDDAKQQQKVVDTASAATGEFLKMALDGKNAKALEKVELVGDWSGYGLAAMGLAIETADIVNMTYGQIAMLGSLVSAYEYNMTMLDAMIEECGRDCAIGQACQRIKNDMDNQFKANCREIAEANLRIVGETIEAGSLFLFDKIIGDIANAENLKIINLKVSKDGIKAASKTVANPAFLKSFSGAMSGMMLGGKVGALLTNNAGVMLDAKEEILLKAITEAQVRESVQDAYDDRSAALKPLTQLWTVVQMDGLNASEKYALAYEKEISKHTDKKEVSFESFIVNSIYQKSLGGITGNVGYIVFDGITEGVHSLYTDLVFGDIDQAETNIYNLKISIEEDKASLKEIAQELGLSFGISLLPDMVLTNDYAIPAGDTLDNITTFKYVPYNIYVYTEPKDDSSLLVNEFTVSENGLWLPYEAVRSFESDGNVWLEVRYNEDSFYIRREKVEVYNGLSLWEIRIE